MIRFFVYIGFIITLFSIFISYCIESSIPQILERNEINNTYEFQQSKQEWITQIKNLDEYEILFYDDIKKNSIPNLQKKKGSNPLYFETMTNQEGKSYRCYLPDSEESMRKFLKNPSRITEIPFVNEITNEFKFKYTNIQEQLKGLNKSCLTFVNLTYGTFNICPFKSIFIKKNNNGEVALEFDSNYQEENYWVNLHNHSKFSFLDLAQFYSGKDNYEASVFYKCDRNSVNTKVESMNTLFENKFEFIVTSHFACGSIYEDISIVYLSNLIGKCFEFKYKNWGYEFCYKKSFILYSIDEDGQHTQENTSTWIKKNETDDSSNKIILTADPISQHLVLYDHYSLKSSSVESKDIMKIIVLFSCKFSVSMNDDWYNQTEIQNITRIHDYLYVVRIGMPHMCSDIFLESAELENFNSKKISCYPETEFHISSEY